MWKTPCSRKQIYKSGDFHGFTPGYSKKIAIFLLGEFQVSRNKIAGIEVSKMAAKLDSTQISPLLQYNETRSKRWIIYG